MRMWPYMRGNLVFFYVAFLGHLLEAVAQTSWDESLGDRRGRWFLSLLTRLFFFSFFFLFAF